MGTSPRWQDIVTLQPHLHARLGTTEGAEEALHFAAHLGTAAEGDSSSPLSDPASFFAITYRTQALCALVEEVADRLKGKAGQRTLRLQSGFGGGKTHALLTLMHWSRDPAESGFVSPPANHRLAICSGLDFDPQLGINTPKGPTCQTLWGALAWQLGGQEGWELLRAHDQGRSAPGGALLHSLLDKVPSLLLLDELLLYIEKTLTVTVGESTLGQQNLVFLQTLTEVVRNTSHAALVYSLPVTEQEAMGNKALLSSLETLSNRLEARRVPLPSEEVVHVLQRWLFADRGSEQERGAIAAAYVERWRQLRQSQGSTREQTQQRDAQEALVRRCYPFHPSLVQLVTEQWWELASYQRTRGALQLLSHAVLARWAQPSETDESLLTIGQLPFEDELWRQRVWAQLGLPDAFEEAVQHECIHKGEQQDEVTDAKRLLFLYSFGGPSQNAKGLRMDQWLAQSLHPKRHPGSLQMKLTEATQAPGYLHVTRGRYAFQSQPNLLYQVEQECARWRQEEVEAAAFEALKRWLGETSNVRLWPSGWEQVPDGQAYLQVVYLSPEWADVAPELLPQKLASWVQQKSSRTPRLYRNALVFVQPSAAGWEAYAHVTRRLLVLSALAEEGTKQKKTVQKQREALQERWEAERPGMARQMYDQVWVPTYSPEAGGLHLVSFSCAALSLQSQDPVERVKEGMQQGYQLIPTLTASKMERLLFEGGTKELSLGQLQDAFFGHLNFPRVAHREVLQQAIQEGIKEQRWQLQAPSQGSWRWDHQERLLKGPAQPQPREDTRPLPSPPKQAPHKSTHELDLSVSLSAGQWQALGPLLQRLTEQGALELELKLRSEEPLSARWLQVQIKDYLEEAGLPYRVKSSSQSGK